MSPLKTRIILAIRSVSDSLTGRTLPHETLELAFNDLRQVALAYLDQRARRPASIQKMEAEFRLRRRRAYYEAGARLFAGLADAVTETLKNTPLRKPGPPDPTQAPAAHEEGGGGPDLH